MDKVKKENLKTTLAQKELLKERLKGILIGLSLEKSGMIEDGSAIDYLDKIIAYKGNEIFDDEPFIREELKDIEWSKEESKKISQLMLKKNAKKKEK